jgi:hypothetical protein
MPADSKRITMSMHLPKAIERFMSSENARDADALAECFASNATVRDEGRTREGLTDIAAWRRVFRLADGKISSLEIQS